MRPTIFLLIDISTKMSRTKALAVCHRAQTLYLYKLAQSKEVFWRIEAVFKNTQFF